MSFEQESAMMEAGDIKPTRAYTRQQVQDYLRDVAEQRAALEAAIASARTRAARANEKEEWIAALERRVGQWIVMACAQAKRLRSEGSEEEAGVAPIRSPGEISKPHPAHSDRSGGRSGEITGAQAIRRVVQAATGPVAEDAHDGGGRRLLALLSPRDDDSCVASGEPSLGAGQTATGVGWTWRAAP